MLPQIVVANKGRRRNTSSLQRFLGVQCLNAPVRRVRRPLLLFLAVPALDSLRHVFRRIADRLHVVAHEVVLRDSRDAVVLARVDCGRLARHRRMPRTALSGARRGPLTSCCVPALARRRTSRPETCHAHRASQVHPPQRRPARPRLQRPPCRLPLPDIPRGRPIRSPLLRSPRWRRRSVGRRRYARRNGRRCVGPFRKGRASVVGHKSLVAGARGGYRLAARARLRSSAG